jgi:tetratricopeptide (TPR) repeat protein
MRTTKRALALTALVAANALALPACKTDSENQMLGASIGAIAGAFAGREIAGKKNRTGGTIIGAVIGGVAGYAIAGGFGSKATPEEQAKPEFQQANKEFDAGVAAKTAGDEQAAMAHYTEASRLAPEQPEPYNNQGLIFLEKGDRVNAEASFRKALTVDPEFEPAKTNLQKMGLAA